jgi:hypothetical protein
MSTKTPVVRSVSSHSIPCRQRLRRLRRRATALLPARGLGELRESYRPLPRGPAAGISIWPE